jgi:dihydroorotase
MAVPTSYLIKQIHVVNEGTIRVADVLLEGQFIAQIGLLGEVPGATVIDGTGKYLLPGAIDAQVHFREPGLTHKGDIHSESRAAVAGGVTAFIDMPNTRPNTLTLDLLAQKYALAAQQSLANYGFLLGVNGENVDDVIATNLDGLLGITDDGLYFSGKGNLLADNPATLEKLFAHCTALIAIHSEKEKIVEHNEEAFRQAYGDNLPMAMHPLIRSEQACYEASRDAIALAQKHGARLHILHLSTAAEVPLFRNDIPLREKKITTEVSVHHLWFTDEDYARLGARIKWNPAIKTAADAAGLLQGLLDDHIDIITTDHAPHALDEKLKPYFESMSGAPMVQHAVVCMLEMYKRGQIPLEKIVEKMSHNVATLYHIDRRGFIREGYYADLAVVDLDSPWTVSSDNILYKCGWSPLEGTTFRTRVLQTFVNGHLTYNDGVFDESVKGLALARHND